MPLDRRPTLLRPGFAFALLIASAFLASCPHSGDPAVVTPSARPAVPGTQGPSPADHHLTNLEFQFCLDTDKVVRREAPLLTPPISDKQAKRRLTQAQVIAQGQADTFSKAGYEDFAKQMQAWADGFATGRQMIGHGAQPVDALHPAVHQESILFRKIDCEGDR